MCIIRKEDPKSLKAFCCDFNDVCEKSVTHKVTTDTGTNEKYYCQEHLDEIRDTVVG